MQQLVSLTSPWHFFEKKKMVMVPALVCSAPPVLPFPWYRESTHNQLLRFSALRRLPLPACWESGPTTHMCKCWDQGGQSHLSLLPQCSGEKAFLFQDLPTFSFKASPPTSATCSSPKGPREPHFALFPACLWLLPNGQEW